MKCAGPGEVLACAAPWPPLAAVDTAWRMDAAVPSHQRKDCQQHAQESCFKLNF